MVQGLGQEAPGDGLGQGLAVQARLLQGGGVRQGQALGPGQGQEPLADAVPDARRGARMYGSTFMASPSSAQPAASKPQVQLQVQGRITTSTNSRGRRRRAAGTSRSARSAARRRAAAVVGDLALDAGPQDLHRHLGPVQQGGRMGLGQGGRGDRGLEAGVDRVERRAQTALRPRPWPPPAERRADGPSGATGPRRTARRRCRPGSTGTGPS